MKNYRVCPACNGRMVLQNTRSGAPEVCPLCNGTGKVEPPVERLPFYYIINETLAAPNGSQNAAALAIQDRDFELIWLAATSSGGVFQTELTDGATGRAFQNNPVNSLNQWGTAQRPFPLIAPIVLPARSTLQYRLTNQSGNANVLQLALLGYDLYPLAA